MELEIIAHRGYSAIAPENTLAAFNAAIQHGADSIEFDVQLSVDGIPVIIHNATLNKTTRTSGQVKNKTLEYLKTLDAGAWFDKKFAIERIPTLKETLDCVKPLKKYIYLDVKRHCKWSDAQIDELVQTLIRDGWENRCIVSSFNEAFVERVRSLSSKIALGYIVADGRAYKSQLAKAAAGGNTVIISEYRLLLKKPSLIQESRQLGVDIVVWTVDNPKHFQKLRELGVARIITNSLIGSVEKK